MAEVFQQDTGRVFSSIHGASQLVHGTVALCASAHELRGAAATVTASALAEAAAALEDLGVGSRLDTAGVAQRRLSIEADAIIVALGHHAAVAAHGA